MYEIEKGIPMPTGKTNDKYGFSKMEIGDSVAFPIGELTKFRGAASQYKGRNPGFDYTCRKEGDTGRIWRIS